MAVVVPLFPSVTLTSPIVTDGAGSSSRIVAVPYHMLARVAFVGLLRSSQNVSPGSSRVSPTTGTLTVVEVCPGANVAVPLVAVKSAPAVADAAVVL